MIEPWRNLQFLFRVTSIYLSGIISTWPVALLMSDITSAAKDVWQKEKYAGGQLDVFFLPLFVLVVMDQDNSLHFAT